MPLHACRLLLRPNSPRAAAFVQALHAHGVRAFFGVPDSTLAPMLRCVAAGEGGVDAGPEDGGRGVVDNVSAANEGTAVAMAVGYHLATDTAPCVYMPAMGVGNAVNPLVALAHEGAYRAPMLLILGSCGDALAVAGEESKQARRSSVVLPGGGNGDDDDTNGDGNDGATTNMTCHPADATARALLDVVNVPCARAPRGLPELRAVLADAEAHFQRMSAPYAILVPRGYFEEHAGGGASAVGAPPDDARTTPGSMDDVLDVPQYADAIRAILAELPADAVVVAGCGAVSRVVDAYRRAERLDLDAPSEAAQDAEAAREHDVRDFLLAGGAGHASQVAAGIVLAGGPGGGRPLTVVIDTDAGALRHLGGLLTLGNVHAEHHGALSQYRHIQLRSCEAGGREGEDAGGSGGGAVAADAWGRHVIFNKLIDAIGLRPARAAPVRHAAEIPPAVRALLGCEGPAFLEVDVRWAGERGHPPARPWSVVRRHGHRKAGLMRFLKALPGA